VPGIDLDARDFGLDARIFGDREAIQKLEGFPAILRRTIRLAIEAAAREYQREVQTVELGGGMVKTRSGRMVRSIVISRWDTRKDGGFGADIFPRGTNAPHAYYLGVGVSKKNETWVHPFFRKYPKGVRPDLDKTIVKPGRLSRMSKRGVQRQAITFVTVRGQQAVTGKRIKGKRVGGAGSGFPRKIRRPGIPYMRTAYDRVSSRIERRLKDATVQAATEFNAEAEGFDGMGVG
jgi:hypothetical protein